MIHSLLGVAVVIFLVWLVLVAFVHMTGWAVNLLWLIILVAAIWWLVSFFSGRRGTTI